MAELLSGTKKSLNVGIASFSENTTTLKVIGISSFSDVVLNGSVSAGGTTGIDGQFLKSTGAGVTWSSLSSVRSENQFTGNAGQTAISVSYTVGLIDVYVNGVRLTSSEYTASNGTSIVFNEALFGGESIDIISYTSSGSVSGSGGLSSETDTLDSVTGRGATTNNNVSVGILTAIGVYTDVIRRNTDNSTNTKIVLDAGSIKIHAGNGVTPKVRINGGVGIATDFTVSGISTFSQDVNVGIDTSSGIIMTSPNGTRYRLIISDDGVLSTILV